MVLPIPTLKMLLLILGDLQRLADRRPEDAEDAEGEHEGYALLVAISLLRTQLKIDLDVYDVDERAQLTLRSPSAPVDVVAIRLRFLRRACVDVEHWGRPDRWWRPRSFHWHHYASSSLPRDDIVSVGAACQEVTDQDRAAAAS